MRFIVLTLVVLPYLTGCAPEDAPATLSDIPIIPMPTSIEITDDYFVLTASAGFRVENEALKAVAEFFATELGQATGFELPVSARSGNIWLSIEPSMAHEEYVLEVDRKRVSIRAGDAAGAFYAMQSFRQMLPPPIEYSLPVSDVEWSVPAVLISDAPRFPYRGMHLDVGRHFFDVAFIKRYIDTMSRYKFNYFHWGLTQDQGWRIEIKKYPKLTSVGAWRSETILEKNFDPYIGDGIRHGGFYTQDDVRDIVAYASERFVTVIPEIELPGHSMAAIAAYPELGCTGRVFEVPTRWGVKSDIYCPSEATFTFLTDVLAEVITLFPGKYIHIGGDEVPKVQWEESDLAQQVIAREGLKDEHELQSYFVRRIESFLNANGKSLVGWDEILEGGLAPNATVMSWRGMIGGIEAARQGHDVIMTPTSHAYFDYYQSDSESEPLAIGRRSRTLPLDSVYAFEPVPTELDPAEAEHILGAQGNVWTEYISTPEHAEYMAYPRAIALAEVVWSQKHNRNIDSFHRRLLGNLPHLQALRVNYRIPEIALEPDLEVEKDS